MPAIKYAKGEHPKDLDGAKGGLVIERLQSWMKEPDDMHPLGTGLNGPENCQSYAKKGNKDPEADRTGNKSLPVIKARK